MRANYVMHTDEGRLRSILVYDTRISAAVKISYGKPGRKRAVN